jgi:hypothetical protein
MDEVAYFLDNGIDIESKSEVRFNDPFEDIHIHIYIYIYMIYIYIYIIYIYT